MNSSTKTAVAAVLVLMTIVFAAGAYIIVQPSQHKEKDSWVPTLQYYVTDDSFVLGYDDYYDLNDFCYEVEQNNTCQIAVLIVNSTTFNGVHIGVNDFALRVFEKNGIGQEGKDNGVLFVFSTENNSGSWRVVTGKGVENILGGSNLTRMQNEYLVPYLDTPSNYSTGIKLFIYAIGLALVDNYINTGSPNHYPISFIPLTATELMIIGVIVLAVVIGTRGRALFWVLLLFSGKGGRGGWGGGRTGGGGSKGRF